VLPTQEDERKHSFLQDEDNEPETTLRPASIRQMRNKYRSQGRKCRTMKTRSFKSRAHSEDSHFLSFKDKEKYM